MKKLSFLFVSLFISAVSFSQTPANQTTTDTMRMSLQQCVDYALEHQTDVKNAILDAEISHRKSQEITGLALPQISGKVELVDLTKLAAFFPAEFFGGEAG